ASHLPVHSPLPVDPVPSPPDAALHEAAALISQCTKPVVYAGGGVVLGDAIDAFREFVDLTGLPTVLTLKALRALPAQHPSNLGMPGMLASRAATMAVHACDLLFVVGARLDDRAAGKLADSAPPARVVHLVGDCCEIGRLRSVDVSVPRDLGVSLSRLAAPL